MPLSTSGKNTALDGLAAILTFASLHSSIPDNTGSNELAGGTPAYARKAINFSAAASGQMAKDATDPSFDVPASSIVMFVGYWTAVTAGTFLGFGPINGGSLNGVGTVKDAGDVITSHGHALANGDRVYLQQVVSEVLPTGLNLTTVYYVVGTTTDTFQLSLTLGGAAVAITADGELAFQKVIPEIFGSQGTLDVDTAIIDLNA